MEPCSSYLSCNWCYDTLATVGAGFEVVGETVRQIWRATFGLILHKMIMVGARQWEWLARYYPAHPYIVTFAVIAVMGGIVVGSYVCIKRFCFRDRGFVQAEPPQDQAHLNANYGTATATSTVISSIPPGPYITGRVQRVAPTSQVGAISLGQLAVI